MEITVRESGQVELISIKGRVDSVEAARFAKTLETAQGRGRYRLVIEMSGLEYMSSAGFRALAVAQRSSQRYSRGEIVLTQVSPLVRDALEVVGFTERFKVIDPAEAALAYLENLPADTANPKTTAPK